MSSSAGYITQFNKETNFGYIQTQDDEINKRCLKFHLFNLKTNSKRYVTKDDSAFIGELFDFDIIQYKDGREDEAVNIRHRVLRCPTLGCSRIKAFTHRKALDEHIESKHCRVEKISKTSSQEIITPKIRKKTVSKPQPFLVNLVTKSASVIGRFIGTNGVNIKQFQQANNVHLKILRKVSAIDLQQNSTVQIQVKPLKVNVNANDVTKKLKLLWEKAVCEQKNEDERFKRLQEERRRRRLSSTGNSILDSDPDFESDARYVRAFTVSGDELVRRQSTRYEQKKTTLRRQQIPTTLSKEGHRCAATGDRQQEGTKSVILHQKKKTNMKDKQWMVKEQLDDMSLHSDDE